MAFLQPTDYTVFIKQEILDEILAESQTTLIQAEIFAQSQMESYLRSRFDTANIFNKVDADRNQDIVEKMVHLVLYKVHNPLAPHQIPETIHQNYEDVMTWLKAVSKLEINPDLPVLDTGERNYIQYGSNPKRTHIF